VARCHPASRTSTGGPLNISRLASSSTTAMTMYREMDMRFWLNEAEAEMKALE
jgi:hypothetical protein